MAMQQTQQHAPQQLRQNEDSSSSSSDSDEDENGQPGGVVNQGLNMMQGG